MTSVEMRPDARARVRQGMLVVDELSAEFGGLLALDHVSMVANHGEIVGLIGPNGAGKTTLFNAICGFIRPVSGVITFDGSALRHHHPHDLNTLGIARTLQGIGLCRGMTVLENVMLGAQARLRSDIGSAMLGVWRSSREERRLESEARDLLDHLGIGGYARQFPITLSYAIQKRAALARALMAEPRLLLLDEPASGLSNREMDELVAVIKSLTSRMGILLVEHHMDLVTSVCDRVVVLNFGRVIADGTPEEIQKDPEVATAYLGADIHPPAVRSDGVRDA